MVEVNLFDVKQILQKLLNSEMTREDASKWAFNMMQEADNNNLLYSPAKDESLIWESILFINGIDLQDEPNIYLHNLDDMHDFLQRVI